MTQTMTARGRLTLNLVLWGLVIACAAIAIAVGVTIVRDDPAGGGSGDGEIALSGVTELEEASVEDQERDAAVLDAATKMATSFINLRHDDADAAVEAVTSQSTGDFRKQYEKSAKGLVEVAQRAESVMEGEVLWAGLVSADDDSATVLAATTGTVANKTTDFKKQARNYRLQLELVREGDRWLVRDLQFVQ
ncbi:hypothetical protein [Nocardioides sambongensis]|uniref:hypothetical protein n=1 Tax=Nocardioides sambongensis TaxID=2589074 RepID=UPI001128D66F|nr:hypothetical protein [Nocardioides sambongensis]